MHIMELTNEFDPILQWADDKGILNHGDAKTQTVKLMEEVGELSHSLLRGEPEGIQDALGDMAIVMVSLAWHNGLRLEDCINKAYKEISGRTGSIVEGNFVKDA